MAEITTKLDTIYGRIRLIIGDVEEGDGILPNGRNFLDAEIDTFYLMEGTGLTLPTDQVKQIGRAAALALETAATQWGAAPYEEMLGPHRQKNRGADFLSKRAAELRRQYGSARAPASVMARLSIKRGYEYEGS